MNFRFSKLHERLIRFLKRKANSLTFSAGTIVSIILFSIPFFTREKSESINSTLSVSFSIVSTVLTAATFLVAYLLYEKLSLDRRIMDKQADAVLQLVDFLKGKTFTANSGGFGYFIRPAVHQLEGFNTTPNYHIDSKKIIIINSDDYDIFFQQLMPLIRNYWMPPEIKDKLQFLEFGLYLTLKGVTDEDLSKTYIPLAFKYGAEKPDRILSLPETTLESFISDLKLLVQTIEQWIQDRSSIPVELRLWEPN